MPPPATSATEFSRSIASTHAEGSDGRRGCRRRRRATPAPYSAGRSPRTPQRRALDRKGQRQVDERHRPERLQHEAERPEPAGAEDVGGGHQVQAPDDAGAQHRPRRRRVGPQEVHDEAEQRQQRTDREVVAEGEQVLARVESHGRHAERDRRLAAARPEGVAQRRADRRLLGDIVDPGGRCHRHAVHGFEARLIWYAGGVAGPVAVAHRGHEAVVPQEESGERPAPPAQRAERTDDHDGRRQRRERPESPAPRRPPPCDCHGSWRHFADSPCRGNHRQRRRSAVQTALEPPIGAGTCGLNVAIGADSRCR